MQDSDGQPPSSFCITRQPEEVFISPLSDLNSLTTWALHTKLQNHIHIAEFINKFVM